jgi:hypothetical protein
MLTVTTISHKIFFVFAFAFPQCQRRFKTWISDTDLVQKSLWKQDFEDPVVVMELRGDVPDVIPESLKRVVECSPMRHGE